MPGTRRRGEAAHQPSSAQHREGPLDGQGKEAPTTLTPSHLQPSELAWPCEHGDCKGQWAPSTHRTVQKPRPVGPPFWTPATVQCGQFLPPAPCSSRMAWGWTRGRRLGGWREGRPDCGRSCSRYSRWPLRRAVMSAPTGALRMGPPVSDLPAMAAAGKSPVQDHR